MRPNYLSLSSQNYGAAVGDLIVSYADVNAYIGRLDPAIQQLHADVVQQFVTTDISALEAKVAREKIIAESATGRGDPTGIIRRTYEEDLAQLNQLKTKSSIGKSDVQKAKEISYSQAFFVWYKDYVAKANNLLSGIAWPAGQQAAYDWVASEEIAFNGWRDRFTTLGGIYTGPAVASKKEIDDKSGSALSIKIPWVPILLLGAGFLIVPRLLNK